MGLPTVRQVKSLFDADTDSFVDKSNVIQITKLEEYIADEFDVDYGTDEYDTLEDIISTAVKDLEKRGYNT